MLKIQHNRLFEAIGTLKYYHQIIMDFIVIDKASEAKYKQIRRRIGRLQNGGSIDSLRNLGVNTAGQIGASYVSLKTLAADYETDEKLSTLLWGCKTREEQIIACFLFPPELNREKITQLTKECFNTEIAEYLGSIFLSKHPEVAAITKNWINSPDFHLQIAAITATARYLRLYKNGPLITPEYFKTMIYNEYQNKYVQLVAHRYRIDEK